MVLQGGEKEGGKREERIKKNKQTLRGGGGTDLTNKLLLLSAPFIPLLFSFLRVNPETL